MSKQPHWGRWIVAGAIGVAILVAFNFETMLWTGAALFAEKRPALLRDADWDDPASARRFNRKFAAGAAQGDLLMWLERNRFDIDRSAKQADRLVEGLPCNERVVVTWTSDDQGRLRDSKVTVTEAGCL